MLEWHRHARPCWNGIGTRDRVGLAKAHATVLDWPKSNIRTRNRVGLAKARSSLWTVDVVHEVDSGVPQTMHIVRLPNNASFLLDLAQNLVAGCGGHVHIVGHARKYDWTCKQNECQRECQREVRRGSDNELVLSVTHAGASLAIGYFQPQGHVCQSLIKLAVPHLYSRRCREGRHAEEPEHQQRSVWEICDAAV